MAARVLERFVCRVRAHRWSVEHNRETQGTEETCARCGAHRSTYPGGTEASLRGRHAPPDGHGYGAGGG